MSLAGALIAFVGKQAARRFDEATRDPLRTQTELLLGSLRRNANTEYGRRYNFSSINSIADYQRAAPIITYGDIQRDMERVTEGAKNVFTAQDPVMFAQTSGTTGRPKFIPVTPTDRGRAHGDQMRTWLYHAQKAHPGILDRKVVTMVSPAIEGTPSRACLSDPRPGISTSTCRRWCGALTRSLTTYSRSRTTRPSTTPSCALRWSTMSASSPPRIHPRSSNS